MNKTESGFSLIELLVVIGIFSILLSIGTLQTNGWFVKKAIEDQTMQIYGELMEVRQVAMSFKSPRAVVIKRGGMQTFANAAATGAALKTITFKHPLLQGSALVVVAGNRIAFDESGFTVNNNSFCVEPTGDALNLNNAPFDSIVVSGLRIRVGKRTVEGAACTSDNIQLR